MEKIQQLSPGSENNSTARDRDASDMFVLLSDLFLVLTKCDYKKIAHLILAATQSSKSFQSILLYLSQLFMTVLLNHF